MMQNIKWAEVLGLLVVGWCVKLFLIPAYYSTDFAVHQNWLRITGMLPIGEWYYDVESVWTLDYPPLFAYFQWALSAIASFIDPSIMSSINESMITVYFQRVSVLVTDLPYLLLLLHIHKQVSTKVCLLYFSLPFILLDNIHFQYNLLLQTLFILSVYCVQQGRFLPGAFFYATLINFKHIYIYAAPAFFIYLLKKQVCQASRPFPNLLTLAAVTLLPFLLSFGPFLWVGGVEGVGQILSRLFPFQRGLVHEFWAPNFWALYCGADKILAVVVPRIFPNQVLGTTGLKILPDISPIITILIILVLLIPLMVVAWRKNISFPLLVVVCGLVFFTFGFHVHEKAITPYLNLLFLFAPDVGYLQPTMWLNFINLVPLLIKPAEKLLSFLMSLLSLWMWKMSTPALTLSTLDRSVVIIGLFIIVYHLFIHPLIAYQKIEFLPLMLNSLFCGFWNCSWVCFLYYKFLIS